MWSRRSVTRAGDYLVSTPVARGPSRVTKLAGERGPGHALPQPHAVLQHRGAGGIALRAGELPLLDLRGEDRPRCCGRAPPGSGVWTRSTVSSGLGCFGGLAHARWRRLRAPPGALRQRLQLLGRHGLEDLTVELGDERVGAIGQRQGALQPSGGPRALQSRRRAPEVGVPEDEDDEVEDDRHHRRGGDHLYARRASPTADGQEDVDRVLGVAQGIAEAHRRDDAAEAERERDAVLHQQHHPGHHDRQDDEGLHHRLAKPLLLPGEDVDPG